jgi:hypothetical protein
MAAARGGCASSFDASARARTLPLVRRRSARSRRRAIAPEPSAALVDHTLRWLRLDETVRGMRAMRAFSQAAGARILARARAERLRGRTLYVRVATAAWSQELHTISAAILARMQKIPGGEEVEALRFVVGDVDALPDWSTPAAPATPVRPTRKRAQTPVASVVHEALAGVEDAELRAKLAELIARSRK